LFPEGDELEDGVGVLVLAEIGLGIAEDAGVGVVGQESQHAFLLAAAFGDVVFFDEGVGAVKGDGVEVDIEGAAARQPAWLSASNQRRSRSG